MTKRTEADIQRAFDTLLTTQSLSQVTVEKICETALLHRSSFYRYYPDKYALLRQRVDQTLADLLTSEADGLVDATELARLIGTHTVMLRHLFISNPEIDNNRAQQVINASLIACAQTTSIPQPLNQIRQAQQPDLMATLVSGAVISVVQWLTQTASDGTTSTTQAIIAETLTTVFAMAPVPV